MGVILLGPGVVIENEVGNAREDDACPSIIAAVDKVLGTLFSSSLVGVDWHETQSDVYWSAACPSCVLSRQCMGGPMLTSGEMNDVNLDCGQPEM